ncbi:hypothetical protein NQ176_g4510 [Zarea fungicola]|uniref:Uncharacterized protein n=1 Tax=Zarea fungicola TaxID=93591 RepID=A0ACC1NE75_9HYPO|nr:hypothetical protein NQ176_g4510 [Lecanicillium fungicola]
MDIVLRERQNDDPEANQCSSSPVSDSASSHKPAATQRILLEKETTDASKETSPPRSGTDSANASPNSATSGTSSSVSIPPKPSASTASGSNSRLPSPLPSKPQALAPNSNASNPETTSSVVNSNSASSAAIVDVSESSAMSQAEGSFLSTIPSSSSSTPTLTRQEKATPTSSLDLPGLAAIAPTGSSKNIDLEAVPASSTPTGAGSAVVVPALNTKPGQEERPSAPPVISSATDAVSRDSTLTSNTVEPQPTESDRLSSVPSNLTTRTTSPPSLSIAPSTSSLVIESTAMPTMSTGAGSSVTNTGEPQLQSSSSSPGPHTGMIVGGVIGGAAALGVIALLLWLWKRRSQRKQQIGQPLTPLSYGPGNTSSEEVISRFAAGRQPWTRFKNFAQGWWASNGFGRSSPFTRWENDEKRGETVPLQQPIPVHTRQASLGRRASLDPFSDAHSTEVVRSATTPQHQHQHQHQRLRGILKQPPASASHSRHPSELVPFFATGMARRSRAHSVSGQRAALANNDMPPRIPASRRTSSLTIDPFEDRRNKFRSDPFDLEIDTRMLSTTATSGSSAIFVAPGSNSNTMPQRRDTRASSVYSSGSGSSTSRYTSGVANGGNWGESGLVPVAGPIVAPLVSGGNRLGATDSPTLPQDAKKEKPPNAAVGQAF